MPNYALLENERRFLVAPEHCPPLDLASARRIDDHYLDGTRLRLRRVSSACTATVFKFCRKYESADAVSSPVSNLYLTEAEYDRLAVLPGHAIGKWRYSADGFAIDVFEDALAGLIIAEIEAPTRAAVLALTPPAWAGREITGDAALTGAALAIFRLP